jgi:arylsulfatase A-like enzyme
MRVPLIVRWPGTTVPGSRASGIVELIDLFPTFAEAAGLDVPPSLDGRSFVPMLHDPDSQGKPAAFCDDGPKGRTVRTPNWRLTQRRNGQHELYHLRTDPSEYRNLYGIDRHQQVIERLSRLLKDELRPLQ